MSCDDDRNEVVYDVISVPEQLFAEGITADKTGSTHTFNVVSSKPITAHVESITDGDDISWLSVSVGDRTADGYPITVTTEANQTHTSRSARVSVYASNTARSVIVTQDSDAPSVPDETPINNVSAKVLASRMFAGINIGNTLEAPSGEGSWGTGKVTIDYIRGLKDAGFNAIRIPCAWDSHLSNAATNTIDPEWLDRVDEIVEWIIGENMYAIVNIHWDGGWLEESCVNGYDADVNQKQHDYWTQIANKLNRYDEHLLFAGMNEPGQQDQGNVNSTSIDAIKAYQQTFVDAVRATGGNNATRCLIHQTPYTNIDQGISTNYALPNDIADRSIVEIHYYDPSDFTIMESDNAWGSNNPIKLYWGAANHLAGSDRNCTWGEESYVDAQFLKLKNKFTDNGIPVIVGEYCVESNRSIPGMDEDKWKASRAYWTEYVTKTAKNNGCVPFYWETGGDINRSNGSVINQYVIDALMSGANAGVYPF